MACGIGGGTTTLAGDVPKPERPFRAEVYNEHLGAHGTVGVTIDQLEFRSFAQWRLKSVSAYTLRPDGTKEPTGRGGTWEQSGGHRRFLTEDVYDLRAIPQSVQLSLAPWYWQLPPEKQSAVLDAAVASGLATKRTFVLLEDTEQESSPHPLFELALPQWRWDKGAELWMEEAGGDAIVDGYPARRVATSSTRSQNGGLRIEQRLEVLDVCRLGAPPPCKPGDGPPWPVTRTYVFDDWGIPVELVVDYGRGERMTYQLRSIEFLDGNDRAER